MYLIVIIICLVILSFLIYIFAHLLMSNEENKRKSEFEGKGLHPQKVVLKGKQKSFRLLNERCKGLNCLDKRREYLNYLIPEAERKVKVAKEMYKLRKKDANAAYYATKGKDWAIAGGIANAIAGPAAGIMVASQVMADNEVNKDFNKQIFKKTLNEKLDAAGRLDDAEKMLEEYKRNLMSLDTKIVFEEESSEVLFKKLVLKADLKRIWDKPSNVLEISINNKHMKRKDIATAIDGTVQVKVLCNGELLDDVCVALPCYGVPCGETGVAKTYLQYEMIPGKVNYSFEIEPNFLWLVEE